MAALRFFVGRSGLKNWGTLFGGSVGVNGVSVESERSPIFAAPCSLDLLVPMNYLVVLNVPLNFPANFQRIYFFVAKFQICT